MMILNVPLLETSERIYDVGAVIDLSFIALNGEAAAFDYDFVSQSG